MWTAPPESLPSSFRDPSGFVFLREGEIYRHVTKRFQKDFDAFIDSGLYQTLADDGLLVRHQAIPQNLTGHDGWYATLKPEQVAFISYPYEWSFSMLKDAALLTLRLALMALEKEMILKDASPYNVQFHGGRMTFIDTLSFERYTEGEPWVAYRQFCENFLGPLALMHYTSLPLQQLFTAYPDGLPLSLIRKLLPAKSKFNLLLYLHIHLHARMAAKPPTDAERKPVLSKQKLISLLTGLASLVSSFRLGKAETVWGAYYEEAETRPGYLEEKKVIVSEWLQKMPEVISVIDVGGNRGEFSLLAAPGRRVICADGEHSAVEQLYEKLKAENITNVFPVCIDLAAPPPALGVNNKERDSFFHRATSDLVMMLAIVHHLAIGKNIPFRLIAEMCAQLGETLIIEFVPKEDEKVKLLLRHKKDVYDTYTKENFLLAFAEKFILLREEPIASSLRILFLLKRKPTA